MPLTNMSAEKHTVVAKLGKPHGISGAFRFYLLRGLKSKNKFPKHFLVQEKGSLSPWFVIKTEWLGFEEGFIWFEEVTTPEKAKLYSGRELYLGEKEVAAYFKKDSNDYNFLIGYTATDETLGQVGTVSEIIENPGQVLIAVKSGESEALIPMVEEFIVEINKKKKELLLNLPEGLLDL